MPFLALLLLPLLSQTSAYAQEEKDIEFCFHVLPYRDMFSTGIPGHAFLSWQAPDSARMSAGFSGTDGKAMRTAAKSMLGMGVPGAIVTNEIEMRKLTYPIRFPQWPNAEHDEARACEKISRAQLNTILAEIERLAPREEVHEIGTVLTYSTRPTLEPYNLLSNNCITFAKRLWKLATGRCVPVDESKLFGIMELTLRVCEANAECAKAIHRTETKLLGGECSADGA